MTGLRLYAPFDKIDAEQRMVYGYASTEALDSHGEIVKRDAVAAALPDFMRWGNIREMHQPSAVGKAKEAQMDERGLFLGARIVDDDAWAKVKEGVYSGFSIAGLVTKRDQAQPNIITGCTLHEISLVDRPANPEAVFVMHKVDMIEKEGRRNSADDLARLQAIHDYAADLGAACSGGYSVEKGAGPVVDHLEIAIAALRDEYRKIAARLATLEATPAAPKGSLRSVAKADDLGRPDLAGRAETVHDMIKTALRSPRVF